VAADIRRLAEDVLRNPVHVGRVEARAAKEGRALESYAPDEMRRVWDQTA